MIPALLVIASAFAWLLYETDFMRIRLLVGLDFQIGDCCIWRLPDEAVTNDMKRELLEMWRDRRVDKIMLGHLRQPNAQPLGGWGYAYQHRGFQVEYKIELINTHHKYTFRSNDARILRDAFRVYRNPYLKVKLA